MTIPELLTGTIGLATIVFLIAYAVITFMLPFFVHSILERTKATNQLLRDLLAEAEAEAKARSDQAEMMIDALQRIKEADDQLVIHAQYQTEVTKHQLAAAPHTTTV